MKKIGFFFATLVLALMLSGCSNTGVGQQIESKGNTVNNRSSLGQIVESYYKNYEPYNKGKTHIFAQKVFMDGTLVLTEKNDGQGQSYTNLFFLDENKKIIKKAQGQTPLSMCFTVNVIEYNGCKIIFGNFNDSTWLIEPDKKKPVDIQNILVRFKNGEVYSDQVDKGYIITSQSLADVEVIELYDNNGILQSDLNDLRRYGSVFDETSFVDVVQ
ncbi:hypothetical protein [Desulfosporosinus meridiei]|uniref:Lipoprotein n=1 Tax=Desulfosporosinus meridiei (strain ATCC BAA-275 / DSM 13257 / KCTC 12902 / NCIMB 13706 / S10) TaxID=768704 RepID=J7IW42_DESMD|nr:hypothetical protein [Desulfosporosinus meridiei]AFQ44364.1 hypothetical protein Desmer_2445 [Desulfosporosinus meridiei DSM 13257]